MGHLNHRHLHRLQTKWPHMGRKKNREKNSFPRLCDCYRAILKGTASAGMRQLFLAAGNTNRAAICRQPSVPQITSKKIAHIPSSHLFEIMGIIAHSNGSVNGNAPLKQGSQDDLQPCIPEGHPIQRRLFQEEGDAAIPVSRSPWRWKHRPPGYPGRKYSLPGR